jgi:microcystin-dependent protein
MGNILEITESRPTVQITESGNTVQVVASNTIVITDETPTITVVENIPQVIVQNAGVQGPIGLNWQNAWDITKAYAKSDAVHYGGSCYYCIANVSANALTPPNLDTTHWNLLVSNGATGIDWKGKYSSSTSYAVLDAVEHNSSTWICTQAGTGNDPPDDFNSTNSYWELVVGTAFNHTGNYNSSLRYNLGDTVLDNGQMWVSLADTNGAALPSHPFENTAAWMFVSVATPHKGTYSASTQYYQNEIVDHLGSSYICKAQVNLADPPDAFSWNLMSSKGDQGIQGVEGVYWKGSWVTSASYIVDDVVQSEGTSFICTVAHTSATENKPTTGLSVGAKWATLALKGDQGNASTVQGPNGGALGDGYTFDNTTGSGSASDGVLRFNASDLTAATICFMPENDKDGNDLGDYLRSFNDSSSPMKCYLTVAKSGDNQKFVSYTVSGIASSSSPVINTLTLTECVANSSTTPFADDDVVVVGIFRTGDRGAEWKGTYSSSTAYKLNEAVSYAGSSWISIQAGTNQEPAEGSAYWEVLALGGASSGAGSVGGGYKFDTGIANDPASGQVRFNNSVAASATKLYVHELDAKGADSEKLFTEFIGGNDSFVKGYIKITSTDDPTRFWGSEITRTTTQGAYVHELNLQNNSTTLTSTFTDDERVVISLSRTGDAGLNWRNEYSASSDYELDDCVYYLGRAYVCTTAHSSGASTPSPSGGHWNILISGFQWRDTYNALTTYYRDDVARYNVNGHTYICRTDGTVGGDTPDINTSAWDVFVEKGNAGTNGSDGADGADGADGVDGTTPIGTVLMYGGSSVPTNYLRCNGSAISRSTYSDLFAVLGEKFGAGNGTTTFNLPNMIQKFPMGTNYLPGADPTGQTGETGGNGTNIGGDTVVVEKSLSKDELPPHSHDLLTDHTSAIVTPIGVLDFTDSQGGPLYRSGDGTDDSNPFVKESISGETTQQPVDITPPYVVLDFIIRYQTS